MVLRFTKMHGLGNDFVVLDGRMAAPALAAERVGAIADRHRGVGFDQLLLIEPARDAGSLAAYSILNADGSRAGQCGNGVRCIAAFLHRAGDLALDTDARLDGPEGVVTVRLANAATVAVDMGEPVFTPARIPFDAAAEAGTYPLDVDGEVVDISAVSMGNPHAVLEVVDVGAAQVDRLGPRITAHPRFRDGTNAGFVQVIDRTHVRLRVHERGAGWTEACGSGACAAVAALCQRGRVGDDVQVDLPGGTLAIRWLGPGHSLWMTGPAAFAYDGEWLGL